MFAHLLYRLGLYLGEKEDLVPAGESNVDGHWEHMGFLQLNENILRSYGGSWDLPPSLADGWHKEESLQEARSNALDLIESFQAQERWCWKDPRSSLTMPFWLDLLPDMRVVVCLRNPLEVAISLRRRGISSIAFGLNLWKTYNRNLLATVPQDQYIVTHYDTYFHRPQVEIRRVLDFAGIPASDQLISLTRSRVIRGLRNNFSTSDELLEFDSSGEVYDLYSRMCEEAEWNPDAHPPALSISSST